MKKRGQISLEYLIIVGFVVLLVTGILGIAFFYASGVRDQLKFNQLDNFANKIISNAESVFFAGEPSKATITAHLPQGVQSISIVDDNGESNLVFNISTSSGFATIAFPSDVPLNTGASFSTNTGLKRFEIVASETEVSITEA